MASASRAVVGWQLRGPPIARVRVPPPLPPVPFLLAAQASRPIIVVPQLCDPTSLLSLVCIACTALTSLCRPTAALFTI
jgi:hypothetical protein